MNVLTSLEAFEPTQKEISLTIGNFDGVHLGHRAILDRLTGQRVVLTFSNHPSEVLGKAPTPAITTLSHKLKLLDVDTTLLLPFTRDFSEQSPQDFLTYLRHHVPFTHLILGHDAVIGHNRSGTQAHLKSLDPAFDITYLSPVEINNQPVSSSRIRAAITAGDLPLASQLLGRPYSFLGTVEPGLGKGATIGFKTANLSLTGLCLPPFGVYTVTLIHNNTRYKGIANLGHAPTVRKNSPPLLETHLIKKDLDLYNQEIEVILDRFLRPEKHFATLDDLRAQIAHDIQRINPEY